MLISLGVACSAALAASASLASPASSEPAIGSIPIAFFLFAATLLGVALFHKYTLQVALCGLAAVLGFKLGFTDFDLRHHLGEEWPLLANLFGLLVGFGMLADYFGRSKIPDLLPAVLPSGWLGGFVLLVLVFILSSFLDNIAAAMIGGTVAAVVFDKKVHLGFLAAIVAASNAGGSGSVVGDTTTTMIWLEGIPPWDVVHAYVAAVPALVVFGIIASKQQVAFHPVRRDPKPGVRIAWKYVFVVLLILAGAIFTNVYHDFGFPAVGVWGAILIASPFARPSFHEVPSAVRGSIFLLSLVLCASMMPVDRLPEASSATTLGLGFISAVFDNIPLTKLALQQGGYDWGFLAYAVGFGGSMIWFGSSAGVAISNAYPEARSVGAWLRSGWHVAIAYLVGFAVLHYTFGWQPHSQH